MEPREGTGPPNDEARARGQRGPGSKSVGRTEPTDLAHGDRTRNALELRTYQADAVVAALADVTAGENPVVSLPTGAGKSFVIAGLIAALPKESRILVVVPSRELAEQDEEAIRLVLPADRVGVACAALGRREMDRRVIVGTPQTFVGNVDFDPSLVIVDECHLMPLHRGSWFARLFDGLLRGRATRRIGLTATPFRTADGALFGQRGSWFSSQPFELPVQALIDLGHLARSRYVAPATLMSVRGITKTAGDYNQRELVAANLDLVPAQVRLIGEELRAGRRKAMLFAVSVDHVTAFVEEFRRIAIGAVPVIGALGVGERRANVEAFRNGDASVAVTVAAALTGFDVPAIDLIASCRPTMSATIHAQSIGRGLRPARGKRDLLVLDFADNVRRFGPVHAPHFDGTGQPLGGVAPWRPCPSCGTFNDFEAEACFHCGAPLHVRRRVSAADLEFGTIQWHRESQALEVLVAQHGRVDLPVESIQLHGYRKKSDPSSLTAMLSLALGGDAIVRVWVKHFDTNWWRRLWAMLLGESPAPRTLREAFARRGELVRPGAVTINKEGNFWRLIAADYGAEDDDFEPQHPPRNSIADASRQARPS